MTPEIFATIVENSSEAAVITDPAGRVLYVNRAFCQLSGRTAAACIGTAATALGLPATPPAEPLELSLAAAAGARPTVELRCPEPAAPGAPRLWLLREVGDRARAAIAEQRLHDFAAITSDWLWELGPDLRFTFVSERVRGSIDRDPTELLGTMPGDTAKDFDERELWADHLRHLAQRLPFRNFVHRRRGADGSIRHVSASGRPIFDAAGGFLGYRGSTTEVTGAVEAEAKAGHATRRLEESIESLAEAFALFDPQHRLVLCNEQFRSVDPGIRDLLVPGVALRRLARESLRRRSIAEAVGRERQWLHEWAEPLRKLGGSFHRKLNDRWFQLNLHRLSDGSTVLIGADITEIILREEHLREARDAAERANRMKSEFLATMSHELRTPLNAILGFSEVMRDGLFGQLANARYLDYVADIHQSAQHLLDIISDVLDMSKLEAGQMKPQNERVDVVQTLEHCVRLMREHAERRRLRVEVTGTTGLPPLMADLRMVKQIVLNLLSNAIKFTEPTGEIRIETGVDGRGLWIAVIDTGIGMAAQDIPRALTPFQQIEDPLTRRFEGTGLGLPIVKAIMELHEGSLTIASEPGIGTRATVTFPISRLVGDPASFTGPAATATPLPERRSNPRGAPAPAAS